MPFAETYNIGENSLGKKDHVVVWDILDLLFYLEYANKNYKYWVGHIVQNLSQELKVGDTNLDIIGTYVIFGTVYITEKIELGRGHMAIWTLGTWCWDVPNI